MASNPKLVITRAKHLLVKAEEAIKSLVDIQSDAAETITCLPRVMKTIRKLIQLMDDHYDLEQKTSDYQIEEWYSHFQNIRDITGEYQSLAIRMMEGIPRKRYEKRLIALTDDLEELISELEPKSRRPPASRSRRAPILFSQESKKFVNSNRTISRDQASAPRIFTLEVLDRPGSYQCDVDIFFVHGLFGRGRETWQHGQILWPELLGKDSEIPNARIILSYYDTQDLNRVGYRAAVVQFLQYIQNLRSKNDQRPLIFVAHSLGGTLVKSILLESWRQSKEQSNRSALYQSTRGMIFLGTPHQATSLTAWLSLCKNISYATTALSQDVTDVSPLIKSMAEAASAESDQFKVLMDLTTLSIVSFFETEGMDTTPWVPLKVVDEHTRLHHPREEFQPLVGTHLSIARFQDADDHNYRRVVKAIKRMTNPPFLEPPVPKGKSAMIERSSVGASGELYEDVPSLDPVPPIEEQDMTDLWSEFRRSLGPNRSFPHVSSGQRGQYFKWFLQSDIYVSWKGGPKSTRDFILISGAAGSGKTSLSCAVMDDLQHLKIESTSEKLLVLYFSFKVEERLTLLSKIDRQAYYNARYVMLQSLMAQILDSSPSLAGSMVQDKGQHLQSSPKLQEPQLAAKSGRVAERLRTKPREEVLLAMLRTILADSCQKGVPTYCVIDAIDECDNYTRFSVTDMLLSLLSIRGFKLMITCTDEKSVVSPWPEPIIPVALTKAAGFGSSMSDYIRRNLGEKKVWQTPSSGVIDLLLCGHQIPYDESTTSFGSSPKSSDSFEFINMLKICTQAFRSVGPKDLFQYTSKWPSLNLVYWTFFECLRSRLESIGDEAASYLNALEFMAWSYRPFRISTLEEILLITRETSDHKGTGKKIPKPNIGKICEVTEGIVYLDGDGLHLASRSLRNFIQSYGVHKLRLRDGTVIRPHKDSKAKQHRRLTVVCIRALLRDHASQPVDPTLLSYAEEYWREHRLECLGYETGDVHSLSNRLISNIKPEKHHLMDKVSLRSKVPLTEQVLLNAPLDKIETELQRERFQLGLRRVIVEEDPQKVIRYLATCSPDMIDQESLEPILRLVMRRRKVSVIEGFLQRDDVRKVFDDAQLLKMAVEEHSKSLVEIICALQNPSRNAFSASFMIAIRSADVPVCLYFLQQGADANAEVAGSTALHQASYVGAVEMVDVLVDWGARSDVQDKDGRQPIHCAAVAGHLTICRHLRTMGSSLEATDGKGRTPLFLACAGAWLETVNMLLGQGCNPYHRDSQGKSMLQVAAEKGSKDVVRRLLEVGCSVDSQDNEGRTALHEAAEKGRASVTQLLLDRAASVALMDAKGRTCLHYACSSNNQPEAMIGELLNHGADPKVQDEHGRTAFHNACLDSTPFVVQLLLTFGAAPHVKDDLGATPLHYACASKISATVKARILKGMANDLDDDFSGDNPVSFAKKRNQNVKTLAELAETLELSTGGDTTADIDAMSTITGFAGQWTDGDESGFVAADEPDDSYLSSA